jgi:hypothetical protein
MLGLLSKEWRKFKTLVNTFLSFCHLPYLKKILKKKERKEMASKLLFSLNSSYQNSGNTKI